MIYIRLKFENFKDINLNFNFSFFFFFFFFMNWVQFYLQFFLDFLEYYKKMEISVLLPKCVIPQFNVL